MRAVVLSDQAIIDRLNRDFVNVWVLNRELKVMRLQLGLDNLAPLPSAIVHGWQPHSPVDCLVISPDLELLGCQPVNDMPRTAMAKIRAYKDFLTSSLEGDRPGLNGSATGKPAVTSKEAPDQELKSGKEARSPRDPRVLQRMLANFDRMTIELVGPGQIKIDGKGPLTEKEARAEAVRVALESGSLVVML